MILLESKVSEYKILSENSLDKLIEILNELTDLYESKNIFFVNEIRISNTSIVRDFATKEKGYCFSLIISDSLANTTSLAQMVRVPAEGC
jgi:hypothetical protein